MHSIPRPRPILSMTTLLTPEPRRGTEVSCSFRPHGLKYWKDILPNNGKNKLPTPVLIFVIRITRLSFWAWWSHRNQTMGPLHELSFTGRVRLEDSTSISPGADCIMSCSIGKSEHIRIEYSHFCLFRSKIWPSAATFLHCWFKTGFSKDSFFS